MSWLAAPFRWLLAAPARWMGKARGFFGWSLPTRVAVVIAVFSLLTVIGYYIASALLDERAVFSPKLEPRFVASVLLLVVATPIAAYFAVRFWLETEPSQYPDIDEAWELGIRSVARAGIDLDQVPLLLVTGVASPREADNLLAAADWELMVNGEPEGKSPLRWYASRDTVVVFLLEASAASALQHQAERMGEFSVPEPATQVRGTMLGASSQGDETQSATGIRGTILAGDSSAQAPQSQAAPATGIRGTMLAGQTQSSSAGMKSLPPVGLDRKQIAEQADRLARVCRLAAESRQPLCPFNGTITVIDWEMLLSAPSGQMASVVREDASQMLAASKLHVPLAVLVNGMDNEMGFIELVRRVGEARAHENRFGHGFNHQAPLSTQQLSALAVHACGAFEDWIYDLFRHPGTLTRSNNDKLYGLLCKIRSDAQPRLIEAVSSFAGAVAAGTERGPLVCGVYFASAGGSRMRQAFVRSVFDKVVDLEEDLEWSDDAWRQEDRYQNIVRFVLLINGCLVVAIIALLVYYFFFKSQL